MSSSNLKINRRPTNLAMALTRISTKVNEWRNAGVSKTLARAELKQEGYKKSRIAQLLKIYSPDAKNKKTTQKSSSNASEVVANGRLMKKPATKTDNTQNAADEKMKERAQHNKEIPAEDKSKIHTDHQRL